MSMPDRAVAALRTGFIGAALGLTATAAGAQPAPAAAIVPAPTTPTHYSAADIAAGGARSLGVSGTYSFQVSQRTESGPIEIHDEWNDIFIVQEGQAVTLLGGTVTGAKTTAGGEHRGGTLTGARSQPLGPGDVLFIPAGAPHQTTLAPGAAPFRYIVFKTKP
jgi:mannose-6-phosphate isomerase-like protein (cupin superfamily)